MTCCAESTIPNTRGASVCCPRDGRTATAVGARIKVTSSGLLDWALLLSTGVSIGVLAVLRLVTTLR